MRIYLMLMLCLAGAACGRSVQEVEDLLETLHEALETVEDREYEETQNKAPITIWDRRAEGETETVKVSENGVVFAETISFDDEHQCETLHVPEHNGRAEVDILNCFKSEEHERRRDTPLKQQEEGIGKFESQANAVISGNSIDIQNTQWVITGVADRAKLPDVLSSFKPDFKVYFAEILPDDAVILPDAAEGEETEESAKRHFIGGGSRCSGGAIAVIRYYFVTPIGCEYLVFCTGWNTWGCPRRHVTARFYKLQVYPDFGTSARKVENAQLGPEIPQSLRAAVGVHTRITHTSKGYSHPASCSQCDILVSTQTRANTGLSLPWLVVATVGADVNYTGWNPG
ncbi:hypothetical protein Bbelb_204870 [Branchiostoma belcheri]|nr:hypothetical protein Bbelb_204870 [Branchiostoma belcheri]